MSEQQNFGFGKFVPGFDFLQNLGKGASQTQAAMPNLSSWVAPTLNVEELDKRISELKAVHFWLDQNSRALSATIQALELQKMTLATLKGMNFNMADIANALKLDPSAGAAASAGAGSVAGAANDALAKARADKKKGQNGQAASGVVDPLQWWGALTQQFQAIAAGALKEADKAAPVQAPAEAPAAKSAAAKAPAKNPPKKTAGASQSGAAKKTAARGARNR